jgi:hypothetical protein
MGGSSRRKLAGMLLAGSALIGELAGELGGTEGEAPAGATQVELLGGWLGGGGSGRSDAPGFWS